ncbi:hypothetical protein B0H17DRAFT_1337316 [Mycena rosella]|uniref:Uncharacterized protein n=1 Tax=Mycena rosella TaxID=1033263 RepID=A0AAD7CRZ7_MYCRO|nr:hypothetical protein B0H17DRAFT_1337316 [Mycena rosella]
MRLSLTRRAIARGRIRRTCTFRACLATSTRVETRMRRRRSRSTCSAVYGLAAANQRVGSGAAWAWRANERVSGWMLGASAGRGGAGAREEGEVEVDAKGVEEVGVGVEEEEEGDARARQINPLTHPTNHIACRGNMNARSAETTRVPHTAPTTLNAAPSTPAAPSTGAAAENTEEGERGATGNSVYETMSTRCSTLRIARKVAAKRVLERRRG